jgi:hypothetical protein
MRVVIGTFTRLSKWVMEKQLGYLVIHRVSPDMWLVGG